MRYLIDTDIIIDHLRGIEKATNFLKGIEYGLAEASISVITEYEVLAVPKLSRSQQEKIGHLLDKVLPSIAVTSAIIKTAALFYRRYPILKMPDAIIAATACHTQSSLVTRNTKHFRRINEITVKDLLQVDVSSA